MGQIKARSQVVTSRFLVYQRASGWYAGGRCKHVASARNLVKLRTTGGSGVKAQIAIVKDLRV